MDIELRSGITYVVELFDTEEHGHVRRVTVIGNSRTHWSVKVRRDPVVDPIAFEVIGNEWSRLDATESAELENAYQKRWRAVVKELR